VRRQAGCTLRRKLNLNLNLNRPNPAIHISSRWPKADQRQRLYSGVRMFTWFISVLLIYKYIWLGNKGRSTTWDLSHWCWCWCYSWCVCCCVWCMMHRMIHTYIIQYALEAGAGAAGNGPRGLFLFSADKSPGPEQTGLFSRSFAWFGSTNTEL
jgi:hypothetical protein